MPGSEKKYATLRQLTFQKEIPMLYLQGKIRKLEVEFNLFRKAGVNDRHYAERKLGILYKMLMKYAD